MNSVGKIVFHFDGANREFFQELYGGWDTFFLNRAEKPTDEILMLCDNVNEHIEIDILELDLGLLPENDFNIYFEKLYKQTLYNSVIKHLKNNDINKVVKISKDKKISELLFYFLLHGTLPWDTESKYRNIDILFMEVASNDSGALKTFLLTYGHYTALQQRLVYQLADATLEKGVMLLAPESTFILSYVYFLKEKYKSIEKPVITQTEHRNAVWQVVYAYLLDNRGSYFNRKSFLRHTITRLAKKHNLEYSFFMDIIAEGLKGNEVMIVKPELYLILSQLKNEMPKESLEGSAVQIARLYKIMASTQKAALKKEYNRKVLAGLLKHEDRCRDFLKYLSDTEIKGIVKIIIPQEHEFVIRYATTLEEYQDKGILQGKAGGEFRLLKWQVIFPVLLESNKGFNRSYFVLRTLQKIAAHYNITVSDIVQYLLALDNRLGKAGKALLDILNELRNELIPSASGSNADIYIITYNQVIKDIKNKKAVSADEIVQWKQRFSDTVFREKVLDMLNNEQNVILLGMIFPAQYHFVAAYAKSLDSYGQKQMLKGKASGNFTALKWKIIYAVLFEPQQRMFNKKYFVEVVFSRIAAHYNLKSADLISYFYHDVAVKGYMLPFEFIKIVKELYKGQEGKNKNRQEVVIENAETRKSKAKERLQFYFGSDAALTFLIDELSEKYEYVKYIDDVLRAEILLRRYFSDVLIIIPDTKTLLKLLLRFSADYNTISRTVIMARIIVYYLSLTNTEMQRSNVGNKLKELSQANNIIIKETLQEMLNNDLKFNNEDKNINNIQDEQTHTSDKDFVNNAGLVLLHPYLLQLFKVLNLTNDGMLKDDESRIRAIFLMQYAVFGRTDFAEHELQLNKLMTGLSADVPLPKSIEITENEKQTVNSLLEAAIQAWSKLGNTSVDGFRGSFLVRDGKLQEEEDFYQLTVEHKAYDMLLNSLPWSISTVKFRWMEKGITVNWKY